MIQELVVHLGFLGAGSGISVDSSVLKVHSCNYNYNCKVSTGLEVLSLLFSAVLAVWKSS